MGGWFRKEIKSMEDFKGLKFRIGGFAGTETVGAVNDLLREAIRFYPTLRREMLRVVLVEAGQAILPELGESLGGYAQKQLGRRGVEVRLKTAVTSYDGRELTLNDGTKINTRTVVWTAGITPSPLVSRLPCAIERGRILANECLQVPGWPGVWTLEQKGDVVDVQYDWRIRADKPLLRYGTPVFRPVFGANHRWAMARGEESLKLELQRRRAKTDAERLAVPAPDFELYSRQVFAEQRSLIPIAEVGQAWRFFEERRLPFFQRLIERTAIYGVPRFYEKFEELARTNLRDAIAIVLARAPHEVE